MGTNLSTISPLFQFFKPKVSYVSSLEVQKNSFRLDGGSYVEGALVGLAAKLMSRETRKLGELAQVFGFGPFKRTYIASSNHGIPLLTSSEIMELDPNPAIMSKANCAKWEQYQIKHGWILVSCSGTIGNVSLVPRYWDGWAASQDTIRVVPQLHFRGLIWTYLSLPMVRQLILSKKSGSVIDHIYAEDIASLDLPVFDEQVISKLNELFDRVLGLREASKSLHDESIETLLQVNSLPILTATPSVEAANDDPDIMFVRINTVVGDEAYRLDAHFYNPIAQQAVANIKKCRADVKTVGDVAQVIFTGGRFKRNYVESSHGIPFLSGKNIVQIRPTDLKYLSNLQIAEMQDLLLRRGWTLITRSGTIGRTCFVWKNYEGYAASEHILRAVPNESQIDPGYLYAFLSSRYGYEQILRYRHGSVIDEITDKQIEHVLVPCPSRKDQEAIGDLVRQAYEKRAEAIRLEDEAQEILVEELSKAPGPKEG